MRLSLLALLALVAGPITGLTLGACRSPGPAPEPPAPSEDGVELLLLGLDGASFELMEPMIERGALPNLARLIEGGVSGPMRSELPCLSIVLWTSVATGRVPEAHGIHDWSFEDPDTGERGVNNASRRRVEALWNVTSAFGRTVGFVSWWASWPAEPVNGFIVSDQFTRLEPGGELEAGTFPEGLHEELRSALDPDVWPWLETELSEGRLKVLSDRGRPEGPAISLEERYRQAWFLYGQDYRSERALFRMLESHASPSLLGYLSRKIDIASHYMWHFAEADGRPDNESLSRVLEPAYRYEDALLGRLLDEIGPDVNVVIVSDHGFAWESDGLGHEETAPDGIFIAHGPAFGRGRLEQARLYDVMPIALRALGLPLARDLDGRVPDGVFPDDAPEPAYVDTFEGLRERRPGTATSPLDERIREELRALGYVP